MQKQGCSEEKQQVADLYAKNKYESSVLELVALVSQRLEVMPVVASAKWPDRSSIDVPAREAEILDDLSKQCVESGIDPETVKPFMEGLVEAAKYIQQYCFDLWENSDTAPSSSPPMEELRSELNAINKKIIALLSQPQFQSPDPELTQVLFLKLTENLSLSLEGTELIDETITSLVMNGALKAFLR